MITPNLLAFQRETYPLAHASRTNLVLHACTQPLFVVGLSMPFAALAAGRPAYALVGVALMGLAAVAQGVGHKGEVNPPAPFRSKVDVVARLFAEQLVTFPRFVLSGGFRRAWASAHTAKEAPPSVVAPLRDEQRRSPR